MGLGVVGLDPADPALAGGAPALGIAEKRERGARGRLGIGDRNDRAGRSERAIRGRPSLDELAARAHVRRDRGHAARERLEQHERQRLAHGGEHGHAHRGQNLLGRMESEESDLAREPEAGNELHAAKAQLQRAVSMRDDFMSMIAHELRNPLNSVYLQAQLRRKMVAGPRQPDAQAMLRMVERDERQIRSMVRLLDDMLDVSRVRTGKLAIVPVPFDLAASAQVVVEAIQEQAKTTGVAVTLAAPDSLQIVGDEFRIEQVITNLLTNALRYGQGRAVAVTVGLREDGDEAFVSVRDQGMGIAPADQERIFEQFERTEGAAQVAGLGLGLYIARQIAQAHQGRLEVRSAPGEGSEFILSLPSPAPGGGK